MALLLLSIISAYIGFGFNRMQDPDMIFAWYKEWLEQLPYSIKELSYEEALATGKTRIKRKNKLIYYITKPLGICIICNTTWIGMFLAFMLFRGQPLLFLNIFIVGVASAGIVVMIINKYHNLQNN